MSAHDTVRLSAHLRGPNVAPVEDWLRLKAARSPHTRTAYARAANRLLTWCQEHALGLLELTELEASDYLRHLAAPPVHWLRSRKARPPFQPTQLLYGRLNPVSLRQERTLLVMMFAELQDMGRVFRNPFRMTTTPQAPVISMASKALSEESWTGFLAALDATPDTPEHIRWRWVARLLYYTGIRRIEARFAAMADFQYSDGDWTLRVTGKRQKVRNVTVGRKLLAALETYRTSLGLNPLPSPAETELPVVFPLLGEPRFLSARTFNQLVDRMAAFGVSATENPHLAAELGALTPHRFRHTNATHRLAHGASRETTQEELGHAHPGTMSIYAKSTRTMRRKDAELL